MIPTLSFAIASLSGFAANSIMGGVSGLAGAGMSAAASEVAQGNMSHGVVRANMMNMNKYDANFGMNQGTNNAYSKNSKSAQSIENTNDLLNRVSKQDIDIDKFIKDHKDMDLDGLMKDHQFREKYGHLVQVQNGRQVWTGDYTELMNGLKSFSGRDISLVNRNVKEENAMQFKWGDKELNEMQHVKGKDAFAKTAIGKDLLAAKQLSEITGNKDIYENALEQATSQLASHTMKKIAAQHGYSSVHEYNEAVSRGDVTSVGTTNTNQHNSSVGDENQKSEGVNAGAGGKLGLDAAGKTIHAESVEANHTTQTGSGTIVTTEKDSNQGQGTKAAQASVHVEGKAGTARTYTTKESEAFTASDSTNFSDTYQVSDMKTSSDKENSSHVITENEIWTQYRATLDAAVKGAPVNFEGFAINKVVGSDLYNKSREDNIPVLDNGKPSNEDVMNDRVPGGTYDINPQKDGVVISTYKNGKQKNKKQFE